MQELFFSGPLQHIITSEVTTLGVETTELKSSVSSIMIYNLSLLFCFFFCKTAIIITSTSLAGH